MKKSLLILLIIIPTILTAQVKFTASSEKVVSVGETFVLRFSVNANASGFRAPSFSNFSVLSGPNTSTSQSFKWINGKQTQSIENSYSYYLRANKPGNYTIPVATVTVKGKQYKSNKLKIEVVKGSKPNNNNTANSKENIEGVSSKDLFLRVNVSKTKVYKGEHIIATVKIYTRAGLLDLGVNKLPSYTGFWAKDIINPSRVSLERQNVNGKIYEVALLKQSILFPQKTGVLTINPAEVEVVVREKRGKGRDFFGRVVDRYVRVNKKLKSPRVNITVTPLPGDNKPENFSGIIGQNIKFSASIDKNNVKTEEGLNLKLKISGNGNLSLLDKFDIKFPKSFDKYDPKISDRIKHTTGGSVGAKYFEYFLIPQEPGNYKIAPIELSYFDIKTKTYKTIYSKEFNIKVEKGDGYVENKQSYSSQNNVEAVGKDIKFIKQNVPDFIKETKNILSNLWFYLWYILSLLIFIIIVVLKRKSIKENADIAKMKTKKASKASQKRLKTANTYLKNNKNEEFYKEILQATWGYLGDKLSLPAIELTKDKVKNILSDKNIEESLITKLIDLLDTCEYAQYAPKTSENTTENIYKNASNIITELDRNL